jgi:endonuclease-3
VSLGTATSRARETYRRLRLAHPDAHCELNHNGPFELLVATVLSANQITPAFFARWPDAASLARAKRSDVERSLSRLGMFRQKSKHLLGLAQQLVTEYSGHVPDSLAALVELPGVGRKTANVVLSVAFHAPEGVVVDTHVQRLAQRLGWSREVTADKIESDLMQLFPRRDWGLLSHTLIFHGRRICTARKPACAACPVCRDCPSALRVTPSTWRAKRKASKRARSRSK